MKFVHGIQLRIVPGPASSALARRVSEIAGLPIIELESKIFPDGESYLRLGQGVKGEDVAVIQSTYPPQDRNLMQLLLMVLGLKDLGCGRVYAVVPYLSYMRQDKRFLEGEVVSARSILEIMKCCHIEGVVTIDVHNRETLESFNGFGTELTAMPLLAHWIRSRGWQRPLIIAPDKGAKHRAMAVSEALSTDYAVGTKDRDRKTGSVTVRFGPDLSANGRIAVIVDDVIARGDTIVKTAEILLQRGAERVSALCTHGLFLDDAIERIESAGVREIVSTDAIPSVKSEITVAPIISDALKSISS